MIDNLVSLTQLEDNIKHYKRLLFLFPNQRKELKELEKQANNIHYQIEKFNERFSDRGWCAYDNIELKLLEKSNNEYEKNGIDAAEQLLIEYYQNEVKDRIFLITNSSKSFSIRNELIQQFFNDHFAKRYYSSIPLGLIIIDGAVNDFTKDKGFFAEKTSLSAWDSLVGCSNGLQKMKDIFNKPRKKTNIEKITLPYRNGILHGRDLNYANEFVSCKCVSLMFAVADWMRMKEDEDKRKENYIKENFPIPVKDIFKEISTIQKKKIAIENWKKRDVIVGIDIPSRGKRQEYQNYPYILPLIDMMDYWKNKNYGKLADCLKLMFDSKTSYNARAGECRKIFNSKILKDYEIIEVNESGCSMSKLVVKVTWLTNTKECENTITFNSIYMFENMQVALPWENNGKWTLKLLNSHILYF